MSTPAFEIPVAHIDDPESIAQLEQSYAAFHGDQFQVRIGSWHGETQLVPPDDRTAYRFLVTAESAVVQLLAGDTVRGGTGSAYDRVEGGHSRSRSAHREALWPGDALISNDVLGPLSLAGSGTYFVVTTETTEYPSPKVSLLRNLGDQPGGCAAYDQAFRRETLPPAPVRDQDLIGVNRVNEHTLDMRNDRTPLPSKHHHGTIKGPDGTLHTHTETAVVLARSVYGLPEVAPESEGSVIVYRDPEEKGTADSFTIPVRPGSIIVTPSTPDRLYGHCFSNAFAMLIALPGFVAPYVRIGGN